MVTRTMLKKFTINYFQGFGRIKVSKAVNFVFHISISVFFQILRYIEQSAEVDFESE